MHLANLLAGQGEGQRAKKYYQHVLKLDPASVSANYGLGMVLQHFSQDKEAPIPYYQSVIKFQPSHYKALTQLAIVHLALMQIDRASEYVKKAIHYNKNYPLSLITWGNLCFEVGKSDKAIKYHLAALKNSPQEVHAFIGLGNAYYDIEKPMDAIGYYARAL